jgi:protein arginine N-methyltransferase 1
MIGDRIRLGAYEAALRKAIRPGSTVVEIGAGTGFFAVLACKLGAERVYAIEPDDSIQVAREVAEANGVSDRIEFFQDLSTRVALPERMDVMFSDLRGILPLWGHHFEAVEDARRRFLKPGGFQIPMRDRVWVAVVEAEEQYHRHVTPWGENHRQIDLTPATRRLANTISKSRFAREQLLCPPALWADLDYTADLDANISGSLEWMMERSGTAHGLVAWFDAELLPGIGFSNAPGLPEALYGNLFFPFQEPVACAAGDRVQVRLRAHLMGDEYVWQWRTRRMSGTRDEGDVRFSQSSLGASLLSPERFRRWSEGYVPRLGDDGRIDLLILQAMDGASSAGTLAERIRSEFPERFPTYPDALKRVSALAGTHSE